MGVLVTLESVITGENQNGGGDLLLIGQRSSELNVFLPRTRRDTGPQLSGFRAGDRIRVTGIASQYCTLPPYDRYFQILIPNPSSAAVIERGWAIQPPVLLAVYHSGRRTGGPSGGSASGAWRGCENRCGCSIRWASR